MLPPSYSRVITHHLFYSESNPKCVLSICSVHCTHSRPRHVLWFVLLVMAEPRTWIHGGKLIGTLAICDFARIVVHLGGPKASSECLSRLRQIHSASSHMWLFLLELERNHSVEIDTFATEKLLPCDLCLSVLQCQVWIQVWGLWVVRARGWTTYWADVVLEDDCPLPFSLNTLLPHPLNCPLVPRSWKRHYQR